MKIVKIDRDPALSDIKDYGLFEKDLIQNSDSLKTWVVKSGLLLSVPMPEGGSGETLVCDRDPTSDEVLEYGDVQSNCFFRNSVTKKLYSCFDNTPEAMVWDRISINSDMGSTRSYSSESISFNSSRAPNSTKDVLVTTSIQISLTILQSSTISVQIDSGSGFVTIQTIEISGIVITKTDNISFVVPAGCQYKILSSGTGTNSIISNFELTL